MLKSTKFENILSETELNRVAKLASSFDEKFSESFARIDGWENRMPMIRALQAIYGPKAVMNGPSHPHRQKWGEFYNEFFP